MSSSVVSFHKNVPEFVACATEQKWLYAANIPPELIRLIAEYFVLSDHEWGVPPERVKLVTVTDEFGAREKVTPGTKVAAAKNAFPLLVARTGADSTWVRVWGSQPFDNRRPPYFAVAIEQTEGVFGLAVGVSTKPYPESSGDESFGADRHSRVVYFAPEYRQRKEVPPLIAVAAANQKCISRLLTTPEIDSYRFRDSKTTSWPERMVVGMSCDMERNVCRFWLDDKPIVLSAREPHFGVNSPDRIDKSMPDGAIFELPLRVGVTPSQSFPIVASFNAVVTFTLLPEWKPPPDTHLYTASAVPTPTAPVQAQPKPRIQAGSKTD